MDKFGPHFERARNTKDLGPLGDPEMWGRQVRIRVTDTNNFVESDGIVRVQCRDIIARPFRGLFGFTMRRPPTAFNAATLSLNFYNGVGLGGIPGSAGTFLFGFGNANPANGLLTGVHAYVNSTIVEQAPGTVFGANFFSGGTFAIPDIPMAACAITANFGVFGMPANDFCDIDVFVQLVPVPGAL
jgi:hypothetical protein